MLTYDACIKYAEEKHYCPHCKTRLSCCETPPFHIGDGLGWGADVMFVCLNDECSIFVKGWQHIEDQYGHAGSYRYMLLPGEAKGDIMMVGNKMAFTGSIINPEELKKQNKRYHREKEAVKQLETCVADQDLQPILTLILDEAAALPSRDLAVEKMIELSDLACIDPIRNHSFKKEDFEHRVNLAIKQILADQFKKECPYCAEIIKKQAKICKHCNKELA